MIPIVTSLAPRIERSIMTAEDVGHAYQHQCIQSWRDSGFEVISVNAADEIATLSRLYPDMTFVAAKKDGRVEYGKPLVPVGELVDALAMTGRPIGGIINSDILLRASPDLASRVAEAASDGLAYCKRHEGDVPDSRVGYRYTYGFDAFFFDVSAIADVNFEPFVLGVPWWDYLFPLEFIMAGRPVGEIVDPIARHLTHPIKWDIERWRSLHGVMRQKFESQLLRYCREPGREFEPIVLYGLAQGGHFMRYYSDQSRWQNLNATDQLKSVDLDNHITAYAYFILEFISGMSKNISLGPPSRTSHEGDGV